MKQESIPVGYTLFTVRGGLPDKAPLDRDPPRQRPLQTETPLDRPSGRNRGPGSQTGSDIIQQWQIQDFPERGAPTIIFFRKLHENERIWTPGGIPGSPLDPPMYRDPPQWTDTCKNITLPQTLQAVVKEILVCREGYMKGVP